MNTFQINLLWFNLDLSNSFSLIDVNHSVIISANKFFGHKVRDKLELLWGKEVI